MGSVDDDNDELLAGVEEAEDVEPSFECVRDVLEVQTDPLLGYGAFGTVHYAVLIAESKSVALKAVSKAATRAAAASGDSQASLREILFGEAMLLEELAVGRHRNMLKFHGCATVARAHASLCSRAVPAMTVRLSLPVRCRRWWHDTNHVFIAQQLCVGGELPQWIGRHPQYTEQVAAKVMYDLLQALTYCHSEGVVHRDVKPQNLLFTSHAPDAYLKLADWGLATKWVAGEDMLSEYCGTLDLCATPLANLSHSQPRGPPLLHCAPACACMSLGAPCRLAVLVPRCWTERTRRPPTSGPLVLSCTSCSPAATLFAAPRRGRLSTGG